MRDEALRKEFKKLVEVAGHAQARSTANNFILLEVVCELSKVQPEPQKYLSDMFDRIIFRWESGETPDKEAHPVNVEGRWTIETFFSVARQRLTRAGL
jgi:hypothetical protein